MLSRYGLLSHTLLSAKWVKPDQPSKQCRTTRIVKGLRNFFARISLNISRGVVVLSAAPLASAPRRRPFISSTTSWSGPRSLKRHRQLE